MKTVELIYEDSEQLSFVDVVGAAIQDGFFKMAKEDGEEIGQTTKGLVSYRVYESDKEVE